MWTWIVFTKYSEETSSNRRKRRKDTRDILIKKARLKQRSILVLREQRESSLDFFSYHHNMSRAASALCFLIFTGNADMSRILLERTGILLAYKYIYIFPNLMFDFCLEIQCDVFISNTSLLRATMQRTDPASQRLCTLEAETILHEGGKMMQSCQLYIKITPKLQRADGC